MGPMSKLHETLLGLERFYILGSCCKCENRMICNRRTTSKPITSKNNNDDETSEKSEEFHPKKRVSFLIDSRMSSGHSIDVKKNLDCVSISSVESQIGSNLFSFKSTSTTPSPSTDQNFSKEDLVQEKTDLVKSRYVSFRRRSSDTVDYSDKAFIAENGMIDWDFSSNSKQPEDARDERKFNGNKDFGAEEELRSNSVFKSVILN